MREIVLLLKSQKNETFNLIRDEGLEPIHFSWQRVQLDLFIISRLNYQDEICFFEFRNYSSKQFDCIFTPGEFRLKQNVSAKSWQGQKIMVSTWLKCLKREITAPDFWKEIEKYQSTLMLAPSEELVNDPIPAFEADEMHDRLSLLADKIEKKFQLQEEDSKFVRQKLTYLSDEARKQPRRNWENMVIGVMMSIVFKLALDTEQAQSFFALVKECLGKLIHLIGT